MKRIVYVAIVILFIALGAVGTVHAADVEVILDSDDGTSSLSIQDSTPAEVAHIDSDGNIKATTIAILEGGGGTDTTLIQGGVQGGDIVYTLPVNDGDANEVLNTDGLGVLSWVDPVRGLTLDNVFAANGFLIRTGAATYSVDPNTYLTAEADPVYSGDPAFSITAGDITNLGNLSGVNSGDQVVPANEPGAANNFLSAYNSATGAWTKAQPTWANIDKTVSSIADIATRSHTSLSDIGTLSHATIDSYLDQAVKQTSTPTFDGLTSNGLIATKAGSSAGNIAQVGGVLKTFTADVNTLGTSPMTLYTYSVLANTLATDGDMLKAFYVIDGTTEVLRYIVTFAGTSIGNEITAVNGADVKVEVLIIRTGATTAKACVTCISETANPLTRIQITDLSSKDWTVANTLLLQGCGLDVGDPITAKFGQIIWEPAGGG